MDNAELVEIQQGIVSPEPSQMADEALAVFVRDGFKKFVKVLPYVRELKDRFAALPRGKADIMGCHTWKEFCENVLDRTPSAVRKALATENKEPRIPNILLPALERLKKVVPTGSGVADVYKHVRFSATEDGKVLLSAADNSMQLHITLDVASPKPEFLGLGVKGPEDEKLFLQIMELVEKDCPGMPPWAFLVRFEKLLETCQEFDGDPCITYRGPEQPVDIEESWDGQLRFQYLPSLDDFKALFPYTGNFLPDLKSGDEVFVRQWTHVAIETVKQVTAAKIVTGSGTFDREGNATERLIVRLATDEDRQLVAAQQANEQKDQEAEQLGKANALAKRENAIQEERCRRETLLQAANVLLSQIPQGICRSVSVADLNQPGKVALALHVTVEQLERIVVALNPALTAEPVEADGPDSPDKLDPEKAESAVQVADKE